MKSNTNTNASDVALGVQTDIFHFVWIPANQLLDVWQPHFRIIGFAEYDATYDKICMESYTEIPYMRV